MDYMLLPAHERRKYRSLQEENAKFFSPEEIKRRTEDYHKALDSVGIYNHSEIEKYLYLILLLGNIEFVTNNIRDTSGVYSGSLNNTVKFTEQSEKILEEISKILGIELPVLTSYLTIKKLKNQNIKIFIQYHKKYV